MEITTVAVLGGSGFVGRHIVPALAAGGYRVRVPTRNRDRAKRDLILLPTVDVDYADVHDPAALTAFVRGADAVINLVGVLHEGRGCGFEQAHVELARKVVAACRARASCRLLHMSALNAGPVRSRAPTCAPRAKRSASCAIRARMDDSSALGHLRPGRQLSEPRLQSLLRVCPVMPLACPNARFQPVFVEDVAAAFESSLEDVESCGKATICAGPRSTRCASWWNTSAR